MKNVFFLCIAIGFISCNSETLENEIPLETSKIIGLWQIIANTFSIGGPQQTIEVEDGSIFNFDLNGTFTFNDTEDPSLDFFGRYVIDTELLILNYRRDNEDISWQLQPEFKDDTVILSPAGSVLCIEGCSFTLQKIN